VPELAQRPEEAVAAGSEEVRSMRKAKEIQRSLQEQREEIQT
jgi:hypothetical protein